MEPCVASQRSRRALRYLDEWTTDESRWPKNLSLKLFREWFSVEYHSTVWDLAGAPFYVKDWERGEERVKGIHPRPRGN